MPIAVQKIFAQVLAIIMGILAMFTGGNMENIKLELANEVTTETEVVEVQVMNYTGKQITTDKQFSLEKKENGEWVKVEFADDYCVEEIAVIINNLQTVTFKINVLDTFGEALAEGEYRLSKDFGAETPCYLEFSVKAA